MNFAGLTEISAFLDLCPSDAERVRAWLTEIRHGKWTSAEELALDFADVDVAHPPAAVFRLRRGFLVIETMIDFRGGNVLLTAIRQTDNLLSRAGQIS